MSMLSVSDQEILRAVIAERGTGVIPAQGTAVQQVANSAPVSYTHLTLPTNREV